MANNNILTFFVRMRDMASGGLAKLTNNAQRAFASAYNSSQKLVAGNKNVAMSYNEINRQIQQLESNIRNSRSTGHIKQMRQELAALQRMQQRSAGNLREGGGGMGLLGGFGTAALVAGGLALGGTALTKGMEAQARSVSFEVMAGKDAGAKLNADLAKYAQDSIYGTEVFQQAQTMLAFGASAKEVVPDIKMLGDIAMGNAERMSSLTLAFSQVRASGRLMGQDLLQFVNAGFNPLQVISEKTGISMGELKKRVEEGKISFDMVKQAFIDATSEGGKFYNMTNQIAQTDFGKWQAFQGQLDAFATQAGGTLAPMLGYIIDNLLSPMLTFIQQNADWLGMLAVAIGVAVGAYKLWTIAQMGINLAMTLNPIGLVIAAVAGLVAVIVYAWNKFDGFRNSMKGVWEVIKDLGGALKEFVIDRIKGLLSGISGLGSALVKLFKGDFSGAWETGKAAVIQLTGLDAASKLGQRVKGKFNEGFAKGQAADMAAAAEKERAAKEKDKKPVTPTSATVSDTYKMLGGAAGTGKAATQAAAGVAGGGPRQITINIQRLVGIENQTVSSVTEGVAGAGNAVLEQLLRTINGGVAMANG